MCMSMRSHLPEMGRANSKSHVQDLIHSECRRTPYIVTFKPQEESINAVVLRRLVEGW